MPDHEPEPKRFEPKEPVQLDPPKDDPYTPEELSKFDGMIYYIFYAFSLRELPRVLQGHYMINAIFLKYTGTDPSRPAYVAIKGTIFDVSKKDAYAKGGQYHGMKYLPFFFDPV